MLTRSHLFRKSKSIELFLVHRAFISKGKVGYNSSVTFAERIDQPRNETVGAPLKQTNRNDVIDFSNVQVAYESKSMSDLLRAFIVFQLSSIPLFVSNGKTLINLSEKILGERLTSLLMKKTFFGHFCAGENAEEVHPVMDQLNKSGVGSILDYAAEADVDEHKVPERNYEYDGESQCDDNVNVFLSCIETAGARKNGFSAIKLTALGKPEFLERMSTILVEIKKLFGDFVQEKENKGKGSFDGKISLIDFREGIKKLGVDISQDQVDSIFKSMDTNNSGYIEFMEWIEYLSFTEESTRPFFVSSYKGTSSPIPRLTKEEFKKMENMVRRLETIAQKAYEKKVRLMIDAEQTYFQPAIDHFVMNLQRKYNKEFPVIFNTFQGYLKDSMERVVMDLNRAKNEGYIFGAKIVRGAYMIQERKRAQDLNYSDPIQPNIEATHSNYNTIVETILKSPQRAEVMVATHNEDSAKKTVQLMQELNIPKETVFFGQLKGMCDHVSFTLGKNGYSVYKYLPYGPVKYVIPYLLRRAEENSSMMKGAQKERQMLRQELKRRIFGF